MNCACAYNDTAERDLLLLILLLRTALAPYWQSLVYLNCACSITIRYYYTRSRKSKWPDLVAKYQVQWTRIMMNTRLDSSVRIKTRIRTEVTWNRICANTHNSGNYETCWKCSQDWSRFGLVLALSRLRLGFASAMPWLRLTYTSNTLPNLALWLWNERKMEVRWKATFVKRWKWKMIKLKILILPSNH